MGEDIEGGMWGVEVDIEGGLRWILYEGWYTGVEVDIEGGMWSWRVEVDIEDST